MSPPMLVLVMLTFGALRAHALSNVQGTQNVVASLGMNSEDALGGKKTSLRVAYSAPQPALGQEIRVGGAKYIVGDYLGKGSFGEVHMLKDKETQHEFAGKLMSTTAGHLRNEVSLQRACAGKHIVKIDRDGISNGDTETFVPLTEEVEDSEKVSAAIVMELCNRGSLDKKIYGRQGGLRGVADIRYIFKQIVEGVKHIHDHGVAHRDLKPENIFLTAPHNTSGKERFIVKIGDFGVASKFPEESGSRGFLAPARATLKRMFGGAGANATDGKEKSNDLVKPMRGLFGDIHFASPEMLKGRSYGAEVDVWSLGVMLFEMLTGQLPWPGDTRELTLKYILRKDLDDTSLYPHRVSAAARNLVKEMLNKTAKKRITIVQILQHPAFDHPFEERFKSKAILRAAATQKSSRPE